MAHMTLTPVLSSLPEKRKGENSRVLQCCWIFLLLHGLVRSDMSGKQNLNGSQAKVNFIMQHGFKRSYGACRGQSLMLQRNVSLHTCRVFQSFPFQKITRLETAAGEETNWMYYNPFLALLTYSTNFYYIWDSKNSLKLISIYKIGNLWRLQNSAWFLASHPSSSKKA